MATLRGQVRSVETEWEDMRAQIIKGYRRLEKAQERAQEKTLPDSSEDAREERAPEAPTFIEKFRQINP